MNSEVMLYSVMILALIVLLTYAARLFPFILFSRGGETPKVAIYLGNTLPPVVIMLLIIYCLRNATPMAWPHALPELIGVLSVIVLYKVTKNNLIGIVGGTIIYMFLVQAVFV